MPVLIAVLIAAAVVAFGLTFAARSARAHHHTNLADGVEHLLVKESERHPWFKQFLLERRDPRKATGLALTIALAVAALAILAVGLLLEMVQTNQGFARWDTAAARWGADHAGGSAATILRWVTDLGSTQFAIALVIIVGFIELRRLGTRAAPLFLATVVGAELILNNLVKVIVSRERPPIHRVVASGYAFPSGHTASAAATYAAVALLLGQRRSTWVKAILAGCAGGMAMLVASTRVLLGAHWLTDVLAGAALGWGVFALCSIAYGGRLLHFGQPVEEAQHDVVAGIDSASHPSGSHPSGSHPSASHQPPSDGPRRMVRAR